MSSSVFEQREVQRLLEDAIYQEFTEHTANINEKVKNLDIKKEMFRCYEVLGTEKMQLWQLMQVLEEYISSQ